MNKDEALTVKENVEQFHPPDFAKLGYWSALLCGLGAAAYAAMNILVATLSTSSITWTNYKEFLAAYSPLPTLLMMSPPFIVTLVYPVLALAIYAIAQEVRRPFALLGVVFAGVYTAVLGAAYWMQLTFVPQSLLERNSAGLELWVMWHPRSFFWVFESFGYFMMGLSGLCLAFALSGNALSKGAQGSFFLMTPWAFLFMVNEAMGDYPLAGLFSPVLALVWCILFAFISFSLLRLFARLRG